MTGCARRTPRPLSGAALAQAREDHAKAVALRQQRQGELAAAQARAAEFAVDVGLPADTGELAAVRDGLGAYRVALAALWPAAEAAHTAIRAAADAEAELADSRQLLLEASERAAEAREAADAAATTYQELLATVGTAVEELQRRLAEVTGALGRLKTAERDARQREQEALEARGKADGKRGDCGRRSRMRRGCGTTRCASSRRSPPPGCCGSR